MLNRQYGCRIDALAAVWSCWAETGRGLTAQDWSTATRCPGWDIAALYAHVGMFPRAVVDPPPTPDEIAAEPITAVDILRGFNAPDGVAHTMAEKVARTAVSHAAELGTAHLVALFGDVGPQAVGALRGRDPSTLIAWPATGRGTTWNEALRIVLMESVVHLLDVLHGLGRAPRVPAAGLRGTARLLAEVAEPVSFIEAATGRSALSPLPVLR